MKEETSHMLILLLFKQSDPPAAELFGAANRASLQTVKLTFFAKMNWAAFDLH